MKKFNIPTRASTTVKINIEGERFGRLVVIEYNGVSTTRHKRMWTCICDCGKTIDVETGALWAKVVQSCGCLQKDNARLAAAISAKRSITNNNLKTYHPKLCIEWDYVKKKEA